MNAVETLFKKIKSMPTIPDVALAVWQELEKPDCELLRVAQMVAKDPMLSAKVINIANSPMFGGTRQTSVNAAILRLGTSEIQRIVSTVSVMDAVPELPPPLSPADFWMLGLGTALIARTLAEELKCDDVESAYLAGLVHCLGDGLLAVNFPERYCRAMRNAEGPGLHIDDAIQNEFGAPSYAFCAHLLRGWNFPEAITEAVEHQLDPLSAPKVPELACVVHAANRLCQAMGVAPGRIGELDESKLEEIPESFVERVTERGYPDMEAYLLARMSTLLEVRQLVNETFAS